MTSDCSNAEMCLTMMLFGYNNRLHPDVASYQSFVNWYRTNYSGQRLPYKRFEFYLLNGMIERFYHSNDKKIWCRISLKEGIVISWGIYNTSIDLNGNVSNTIYEEEWTPNGNVPILPENINSILNRIYNERNSDVTDLLNMLSNFL